MIAQLRRMARALPRDKADTTVLLLASLLALAPHAAHLPLWCTLVSGATLAWRATLTLRGLRMPPIALLLPVALAAMAGVYASFDTLLGRDAGVAMLVLLLAFKTLEMHARRDLLVVIFLDYFLVLSEFFYSQSMLTAALTLATVIALLTAQLSFQYSGAQPSLARRLRLAARIVAYAVPLALALFVLFPRIQGPLWGMPSDANGARSGLSDSMEPGNVSNLAESDELAFRARFIDAAPPQQALYWRAIVLGQFDGRRWARIAHDRRAAQSVQIRLGGAPTRYEVTLEASDTRWLPALELPDSVPQIDGNPSAVTPELELLASLALTQRVRYRSAAYLTHAIDPGSQLANLTQWLQLPPDGNPKARELAQTLRRLGEPQQRVDSVLRMFHQQNYVYTLEPPRLGRDGIDQFLFRSRAGFCEHYAGAFVFLMRASGVPARVVTGYQGGEINPVDGVMTVRQSDAHAWAEVWLAGRGWVRADPTAAVAPERVRKNLAHALARRAPFGIAGLDSLINFSLERDSWLARLRFQFSAVGTAWDQYVLNYTPQRQEGVLQALQQALVRGPVAAALGALAGLIALALMLRTRRKGNRADQLYATLCAQLARRGLVRGADEGPQRFATRVAALALAPGQQAAAQRFLALYSNYKYAASPDPDTISTLKKLLTESR